MIKTSKKHRIVGLGDDVIDDWRSPLADYNLLINSLAHCDEVGIDFPIKDLTTFLIKRGFDLKESDSYSILSSEDMFEAILNPHLRISNEGWGGDSPGRSGVYKTAYLELGHTREIRKILKQAEKFMVNWIESTSDKKARNSLAIKTNVVTKQNTQNDNETEIRRQQWEDDLFNQLEIAVKRNQRLIRLNYLVFQGVIFYLDRSWWHSLVGSVKNVTNRLRTAGFKVIDVEVISTKIGWIPYFARHNEEEKNLGWNEKTIIINCPKEWASQLNEARLSNK
jgi:hypothetical protein